MKKLFVILGLGGAVAAMTTNLQAQPYYIAGSGVSPSWTPGDAGLQLTGSPLSLSTATLANSYHEFKVTGATWGDPNFPNDNVKIKGDANGTNTFYFYPGTTTDGWSPLNNRIGYADPGNMAFEIIGGFANWSDATNLVALGNGVYSNSITGITPGTYGFKFRTPGTWSEVAFGANFGNFGPDGSFTVTNSSQRLPVILDLPKGRWLIGTLAPAPVTNQVVFAVDMTYQRQLGLFNDGSGVFVAGAFNGWPGTGPAALVLVNDPPYNGGSNTNIYYGTNTFVGAPGSVPTAFKFTQNDANAQNGGWETSNDRSVTLGSANGVLKLPVAVFSELYSSDVLSAPTPVLFRVDMNGAVGTDTHVFDSANDSVYLNGNFAGWYPWAGGINPSPAPAGYQLFEEGVGTQIYTNTIILQPGAPITVIYKYGMDPLGVNGGPLDHEAGYGQDHHRIVRNLTFSPYVLATDKFGNQYNEPLLNGSNPSGGNLSVGPVAAGKVPVKWLGRPGAHLQYSTSLTGGWQDLNATDGATWTIGSASTNGFVSQTNWPVSSGTYFRLKL